MSGEAYDFRKPTRMAGGLEQRLAAWLEAACALAPAQWKQQLPLPVDMSFRKVETIRPADGLAQFPETTTAYTVHVNARESTTLALLPRPFALALVTAALGGAVGEALVDRELTSVEDAVCEYLIQKLFVALLQETWPGAEPVQLSLGTKEPAARWSRLFAPDENLIACEFAVAGPFGEQTWHWLLPFTGLPQQLGGSSGLGAPTPEAAPDHRLRALVDDLPVEVVALLGTAELSLSQLAGLRRRRGAAEATGVGAAVGGRGRTAAVQSVAGPKRLAQSFRIDSLTES